MMIATGLSLREKVELLEHNCDADLREHIRDRMDEHMDMPDLTLEEVLGNHDCRKYKLGLYAGAIFA